MKIFLGNFTVVESRFADGVALDLGKHVFINIHLGDFQHNLKPGDTLPLYTEIPRAISQQPPKQ